MELQEQVCSLELAKRLKELKIKQDSQFYYVEAKSIGPYELDNGVFMIAHLSQCTGISDSFISAFNVAELGKMLPDVINIEKDFPNEQYFITMDCDKHVYYSNMTNSSEIHIADDDDNEADSRAKMLIYLLENGLMKDAVNGITKTY